MSTKSGKEMGGVRGTLLHWWCQCKAVGQPLQKLMWKVLKRLKRELAYDQDTQRYQAEDSKPDTHTFMSYRSIHYGHADSAEALTRRGEFDSSRKNQTTSSA